MSEKHEWLSGRVACDARESGGHCACGAYHEPNSGANGRYINGVRVDSWSRIRELIEYAGGDNPSAEHIVSEAQSIAAADRKP